RVLFRSPVEGIGVPLDGGVFQAVGDAERQFVEVSVGEADQIGLFARQLGQDVIRLGDLLPDFLLAVGAVIVVPVAVTADFIVHVDDPFDDVRVPLRPGGG